VVSGMVRELDSNSAVTGVNVYLSNTTIGKVTDSAGSFLLRNIPCGTYLLVVSGVGYEHHVQPINIRCADTLNIIIRVRSVVLKTPEYEVRAEVQKDWHDLLDKFISEFIGETNRCTLVNPEVLNLWVSNDSLHAKTDSVLLVENYKLGYSLSIIIETFAWDLSRGCGSYLIYPYFRQMTPRNDGEQNSWLINRDKAYNGSMKHFFSALVAGNVEDNRFSVYTGQLSSLIQGRGNFINSSEIEVTEYKGTPYFMISFPGCLRIEYGQRLDQNLMESGKYRNNNMRINGVSNLDSISIIQLKDESAIVDREGNLINPLSIEISGGWAKHRVADLLPLH